MKIPLLRIKLFSLANYRNSKFVPLKEVLDDMIQEMRLSTKMHELKIRKFWFETMGSFIANHTSKMYFRQNKLFVFVDSSALRQELFLAREKLRQKLNEYLGEELVQEIIVR